MRYDPDPEPLGYWGDNLVPQSPAGQGDKRCIVDMYDIIQLLTSGVTT